MKLAIRFAVAVLCLSWLSAATAVAQDQYTEGGVTRVTLVQILPAKTVGAQVGCLSSPDETVLEPSRQTGTWCQRRRKIQPDSASYATWD